MSFNGSAGLAPTHTKYSHCGYCGNTVQPKNALNCHGCGAPLRVDNSVSTDFGRSPAVITPAYHPPDGEYIEVTRIGSLTKEFVYVGPPKHYGKV